MAYQKKSGVLEKLDPTQLKVFTHLPEGIPLGKPVKVTILEATVVYNRRLHLRFQDNFGHQIKQQHFVSNRDDNGSSFAVRQLLSSITHSSQMFKHLVESLNTDVLKDAELRTQYELGPGNYVASHMNSFIIVNENYELMTDTQYPTVTETRQAMLMSGFKEGWAQITGYTPVNTATQMSNTVRMEVQLGDDYAIDSDTDYVFGSPGIDTQDTNTTKANHSVDTVERNGYRKVSSSLPESKRF